jgi:mannose-1-phosphate guanylyltransferase
MENMRPIIWLGSGQLKTDAFKVGDRPFVFAPLIEGDSPFQDGLERVSDDMFLKPLVIAPYASRKAVQEQIQEIDYDCEDLIFLDGDVDALIAAQAASNWCTQCGEDDVLLLMPAACFIADSFAFLRAIEEAYETVMNGYMVSFGAVAHASVGGHDLIEVGMRLDAEYAGHHILNFYPDCDGTQTAELLEKGGHVINSGIYCFQKGMLADTEATSFSAHFRQRKKKAVSSILSAWADLYSWPGVWYMKNLL